MAETFFGITDTGKMRDNNEDAFIAQKAMNDKFIIACVIDGVGGYTGGEVAASIAKDSILNYFSVQSGEVTSMMKEAFIHANEKINAEKQKVAEYDSMACVLTMAVIDVANNQFFYAHVGDTRLYLFRDQSLVKLSKDQSFVGFLEDSGRLSEEEAMNHPKRNEINKALGFGGQTNLPDDYIETGQSPFLPGDLLLLCSDGLTDLVNKTDISDILSKRISLKDKANTLVNLANEKGGKDNITVVLVQNEKKPIKQKATKPAIVVKKNKPLQKESKPVKEISIEAPATEVSKPKLQNNKGLIYFLALLSFVLVGVIVWLFLKDGTNKNVNSKGLTPIETERSPLENKLQNAINAMAGDTLILSDTAYPEPVILTGELFVEKDSLFIKADGNIILRTDSIFAGPALSISPKSKHIVLDGLVFNGFKVAIATHDKVLKLNKVRFINCLTPIQSSYTFPDDAIITGSIKDTSFQTDSLPNSLKN